MNKKDELKIELISNIDEQIIEKQTLKRFRLMLKNRVSRKKIAGWCGAAACLLISFSVLFAILFPFSFKNVPVYEGMTVSNSMPTSQTASGLPDENSLFVPLAVTRTSDAATNLAFYSQKSAFSDFFLNFQGRAQYLLARRHVSPLFIHSKWLNVDSVPTVYFPCQF